MKKFFHFLLLLVSIGWLSLSFISVYRPFAPIGKIFSYPEGIFSRKLPDEKIAFENSGVECSISLDKFGVPTIQSKKANDLAFGIGFMQARDRYFQMEMITRTVQGRLSELVGRPTLERDIFWRPLGTDSLAIKGLEDLKISDPRVYDYLMAYNNGVRFYLDQESGKEQFLEYSLLGVGPREWKDHYPLLLSYYMSKTLAYDQPGLSWASNLDTISAKTYALLFNNSGALDYPYMYADSFNTAVLNKTPIVDSISDSLVTYNQVELEKSISIGSNNWAVSRSKSKSGKAMLCNDTHLDILLPNPWYQVHLICDEFHVQGFSIPCVPYVLSGNNDQIAWGITNGHWDEVDLFKIELNQDSSAYLVDGVEVDVELRKDVIEVLGAEDYVLQSRITPHGIVKKTDKGVYAEKWYALDFRSSIFAFDKIMHASGWKEFRNGVKEFTFPPQNFAYADRKGNVGLISGGILPARPAWYKGEMLDGTMPYNPKFVEFENLPQVFKGDSGFVSSANQMQARTNYFIHYYWGEPYRVERINEFLNAKDQLIVDDMKILHTDKYDRSVQKTIALFDSLKYSGKRDSWLNELRGWSGEMNPIMKTPVKYLLLQNSIKKTMGEVLEKEGVVWQPQYFNLVEVLKKDTLDLSQGKVISKEILTTALDSAIYYYDKMANDNTTYGDVTPFKLPHLLRVPGLGKTVEAKGGSSYTVDVNGHGEHGASMRTIIEMGNTPGVLTVIAGGQSGRVNSKNFADQIEMWKKGEYNLVNFGKDETRSENILFRK